MNKTIHLIFQEAKSMASSHYEDYIAITAIAMIVTLAFWLSFKNSSKLETE